MNVLLVSIYYGEIMQSYPIFVESMNSLSPKPKKIVLYDLFEQKKLDPAIVDGLFEIREVEREKNLMEQVSKIRSQSLKEAIEGNFDALFFLQPNIFPPKDIVQKLSETQKEIIAPSFFMFQNLVVPSNAIKKTGVDANGKERVDVMLFDEFIPSGVRPVFGVSLESVFLRKSVFKFLKFEEVGSALEEMLAFSRQVLAAKKEIFVDSATVCSKLGPMQLMSYYYFKAQKLVLSGKNAV